MTSHPSRLHGLDTLRAFAVLAVVFYHLTIFGELPMTLITVTWHGWMGVDLFFVLSGYLIGRQLLKPYLRGSTPSLKDFYLRRAFRILPAYFTVVALYFLWPAWREYPALPPLWKFITFTQNFGFTFATRGFSHAWSLCVEEHFYLVLPLLVLLMMKRPSLRKTVALIAAVVFGGIALRWTIAARYPDEIYQRIYYPTYTRQDGLLTGVTVALIETFRPQWWQRILQRGHTLFFSGLFCVLVVVGLFRNQDLGSNEGTALWGVIVGFPLLSFGLGLITASAMSTNGCLSRIRVPGAAFVATLAFSLYLTHKQVGHLIMTKFPAVTEPHGPASWLLYAVACLAAALALHYAVERPFMLLRDRTLTEKALRIDPPL